MKPTDAWLINVKAVASPEGWRHPDTNELLKAQKLDIKKTPAKKKTKKAPATKKTTTTTPKRTSTKQSTKKETKPEE